MSKPGEESTDVDKKEKTRKVRTAYDVQRAKLEKLMKDPSKPVYIPTTRTEKDPNKAPDFVYNVRCLLKKFLRNNQTSNYFRLKTFWLLKFFCLALLISIVLSKL
jgi:hypothetical protein